MDSLGNNWIWKHLYAKELFNLALMRKMEANGGKVTIILLLLLSWVWNSQEASENSLLKEPLICHDGLQKGDLIFQMEGNSDFSNAINEATSKSDSIRFVHVGIIDINEDCVNVIEADPEAGVRIISLKEFLENSPQINPSSISRRNNISPLLSQDDRNSPLPFVPGVVVKRLNIEFDKENAVNNAKKFIGQEYDWWYLPDNGKMYCSELVYESYLNSNGDKIFKAQPMNFLDANGNLPQFWRDLFHDLGQEVPQGVAGTNPNDMASDPRLVTIPLYIQ